MSKHGVNVTEQATAVSTPNVVKSGIPFFVGTAPVHTVTPAAKAGVPVLCTNWEEAVAKLGYSDDWKTYTLCEAMYSHFKVYGCQPAVFCNVLDASSTLKSETKQSYDVTNHKINLQFATVINDDLIVTNSDSSALIKGTDYEVYYDNNNLVIELKPESPSYDASTVDVSYKYVDTAKPTASDIAIAIEKIEQCIATVGVIPDLICAPGFSSNPVVAAAMAAKSDSVNGQFKAKALIDIDCTAAGVTTYEAAYEYKIKNHLTDKNELICWLMPKLGDKVFHMSVAVAGVMASVDTENGGCPYESPSNKEIKCDATVLADGTEVRLTPIQANVLNNVGIMTAINFVNGWVLWGNHTACYPSNSDVKDNLIPVNRMFAWVGNTIVKTFWSKLDQPMNRRLVDSVVDTANIWLNGLVGQGYLLGARVSMEENDNPLENLMNGIIKLHIFMTPPSPAQEIDFVLEYDAQHLKETFQS